MSTHDLTIARAVTAAGGIHFFKSHRPKSQRNRGAVARVARTTTTNAINPTNSMHRHIVNANNFCR